MKINHSFGKMLALSALALAVSSSSAFAADIDGLSTTWGNQFIALGKVAGMVAFLAGFVLGIMGLLKLKANAANPNDPSNKVSTAFIFIFTGAALIAIPTVMGVGVGSLFGTGSDTVKLNQNGGGFKSIQ